MRVVCDRNGICAQTEHPDTGHIDRVYLPSASLACLLLGPGTSITQAAITALTRDGTVVVWVGNAGVRCYSAFLHHNTSTRLLHQQIKIVADSSARIQAARRHFQLRFGEPPPSDSTLQQLRGMEGAQVKATNKYLAKQHRVGPFKRSYDPHDFDAGEPVNKALTAGNAALYGITTAVLLSLGASPALGLIHEHNQRAFTYDIADLYKTQYILPTAFSLARSDNPHRDIRRQLRDDLRLLRLVPRMIRDIHYVLGDDSTPDHEPRPHHTGSQNSNAIAFHQVAKPIPRASGGGPVC